MDGHLQDMKVSHWAVTLNFEPRRLFCQEKNISCPTVANSSGFKGTYFIRLGSLLAYLERHSGLLKRSLSRQARCPAITAGALASFFPLWGSGKPPRLQEVLPWFASQQALWITRSQECFLVYTPGVLDSFTDQLSHLELFKWHFEVRYH